MCGRKADEVWYGTGGAAHQGQGNGPKNRPRLCSDYKLEHRMTTVGLMYGPVYEIIVFLKYAPVPSAQTDTNFDVLTKKRSVGQSSTAEMLTSVQPGH